MELKVLENKFSVYKLSSLNNLSLDSEFVFLSKTDDELSLVCDENIVINNYSEKEDGWSCFKIVGVLDFSLIGILSKISTILADHKIGIFVVSTYNTDYILVKTENLDNAIKALEEKEYLITY